LLRNQRDVTAHPSVRRGLRVDRYSSSAVHEGSDPACRTARSRWYETPPTVLTGHGQLPADSRPPQRCPSRQRGSCSPGRAATPSAHRGRRHGTEAPSAEISSPSRTRSRQTDDPWASCPQSPGPSGSRVTTRTPGPVYTDCRLPPRHGRPGSRASPSPSSGLHSAQGPGESPTPTPPGGGRSWGSE
jgi:hypothetical protein